MTALADDRLIQSAAGGTYRLPVAASTTIYKGGMVCDNGSGAAVPAADTAGYVVVGIALEHVDNSSGSAGDRYVNVLAGQAFELVTSGAGAGNIGDYAYVTDDQTVALVPNTNNVVAGVVSRYVSATSVYVYIPEAPWLYDNSAIELVSPQIGTSINDVNGNELFKLTATGSAVNEITVANAATGSGPTMTATGGDTNVPITVAQKAAADINLGAASCTGVKLVADQPLKDSNGNELIEFNATGSAVNQIKVVNAATGNSPSIAAGGETNTGLDIKTRGTGTGALVGDDTDVVTWAKDGAAKLAFFGGTLATLQGDITQTYSTAVTTVANPTSPTAGNGSGADASTFSGAQCDALRAEVIMALGLINQIIDTLQAYKLIGT